MKFLKHLLVLSLLCVFSVSSFGAVATSLGKAFVSGGEGLVELLVRKGVDQEAAEAMAKGFDQVVGNFAESGKDGDLIKEIANIRGSGDAVQARKYLGQTLRKSVKNLDKEQIIKAINDLNYLANKYKGVPLECAQCSDGDLSKYGFKYSPVTLAKSSYLGRLNKQIPTSPKKFEKTLSTWMRKFGGLPTDSKLLDPVEKRTLALYVKLVQRGKRNTPIKGYVSELQEFSTVNGKVELFHPDNNHGLWKHIGPKFDDSYYEGMTGVLKKANKISKEEGLSKEESFWKALKEENPHVKDTDIDKLKTCLFKK